MTIDEIEHRIDARPGRRSTALGYNGTWPGPRLTVTEGDKVRAIFKNNLKESTGVHFHGQRLPERDGRRAAHHPGADPAGWQLHLRVHGEDRRARTCTTPTTTRPTRSGRGLLGAFIVEPKDPAERYDQLYGASQDIVWISNDTLGGFTINGRGFPATAPIVAKLGDKIVIRFMNEGKMMHPWHLHGVPMRVVARDGYPLGSAAFTCDTLGVNPGERWDVVIDCDEPGAWAFHCHILQHAEGMDGMFGMVTALVVQDAAAAVSLSRPVRRPSRA